MGVDAASRAKDKALDAKETVQAKADEVKQQVYESSEALQTKAGEVASQAKDLTQQAVGKVLPPVAARTEPLVAMARRRPVPSAGVLVGVLLLLGLVLRRLFRSN